MWQDLDARRATEVEYLNGEIVRLAARAGSVSPLNQRVVELIHTAETAAVGSPRLSPEELWRQLTAS